MEHVGHNVSSLPFVHFVDFSTETRIVSYAFQKTHASILSLHILFMLSATLVFLPAALLLRKRRYRNISWLATCLTTLSGLGSAMWHRRVAENVYPHALHRQFSLVVLAGIVGNTIYSIHRARVEREVGEAAFMPLDTFEETGLEEDIDSARSSETLYRLRNSSPDHNHAQNHHQQQQDAQDQEGKQRVSTGQTFGTRFIKVLEKCNAPAMLGLAYVQILLGIATYCGLFTGHEIYNGLAHWIKASVFFIFGIWVMMRYLGYAADAGHAWNTAARDCRVVSAETIECGLIFTYGAIDLFLERLGHSDEAISHTDVQHISIALMFASAGFIGLLLESRTLQRLLLRRALDRDEQENGRRQELQAERQSANVMPSLVVFFTGMLMSQHAQETAFATAMHKTWGYYFCIAAVLRIATYCLVHVTAASASRRRPSRPPTEVLVAFCLIAGALVFMASARDVSQVLEYHGIDLMFVISLSLAGALSVLVWTTGIMLVRAV